LERKVIEICSLKLRGIKTHPYLQILFLHEERHTLGPTEEIVDVLHFRKKGNHMNILQK